MVKVDRAERLREGVEIIKRMWIEEKPSYQGKHYRIKNAICEPKPIQKPHPPITIAGSGEKYTLSVVAAHADCWNPHPLTPMDQYIHKLKVLEGCCSQIGRDHREIEKSYHIFLSGLHHDEEESIQRMKRAYEDSSESHDTSFEEWFEAIRSRYILGTPEEILKKIQSIINLGVTHFVIGSSRENTEKRRENLRLFSEEIVTHLKKI